jgi:poly(3-hydroxybutyrate) depolymerase
MRWSPSRVAIAAAVIALAAAACSGAREGEGGCGGVVSFEAAGRFRAAIVHVPPRAEEDRLAGAAFVSAQHHTLPCRLSRPIPVVSIHAVDDSILPYFGGSPGGAYGGAHVLPVETVMAGWAAENGCSADPRSEELEGGIVRLTWEGCAAPVVHYKLPVGGHAWPGCAGGTGYSDCAAAEISATDVLWEFFAAAPSVRSTAA